MPTHSESAPDNAARDRLVISILLVSTFVVILNETVMSVALPRLMIALDASAGGVQWLTTAFLLTMAVVIPVTGFLIQRVNTKPLFILAMVLFSLGTLAGALSPNLGFLIVARVIQACGTAIMMPLLMTTVMTLVPQDRRGPVMGNISMVISVAPAIGPALSGIVLNYLPWPFLFWIILPISLTVLFFGTRSISNITEPRDIPVDVFSVIISAFAFGGIVYGLSGFGTPAGETAAINPFIPLGIGLVSMVIFIFRQIALQKENRPLLDLRTFESKNFAIAVTLMGTSMATLFGVIILLPMYMQNVLGFNTFKTGMLLLPGGLLMGILAPHVGKLYDKIGPTKLLVPGSITVSAVLWAMTLLSPDTYWVNILIGHLLISIGLAFTFTPLFTVSLSSVPPRLYSHGSAMLGSIQQVSAAAGVAMFIAVMTSRSGNLIAEGTEPVLALSQGITSAFTLGACLSLFSIVAALFIRRPPKFDTPDSHGGH